MSECLWESVNIISFGNILGKHSRFHSLLFCTCMSHYTSTNVWKWKLINKNFSRASVMWILIITEKNKSRNFAVIYVSPFAVYLLCVRSTSLTMNQRHSLCPEHTHCLATKIHWTSNYMNKLLNNTILSARRVSVLTREEQQISQNWVTRFLKKQRQISYIVISQYDVLSLWNMLGILCKTLVWLKCDATSHLSSILPPALSWNVYNSLRISCNVFWTMYIRTNSFPHHTLNFPPSLDILLSYVLAVATVVFVSLPHWHQLALHS